MSKSPKLKRKTTFDAYRLFSSRADYLTEKLEAKLGWDLNGDGRIGGPGIRSKIEQATHIDFNRDGIIGGYRPSPGGGRPCAFVFLPFLYDPFR